MAGLTQTMSPVFSNLRETGEMIAFKHTLFALPFAVISLVTASSPGWPAPRVWLWVAVAMVGARTAAMSFNRLADHRLDSLNPRTADRALPAGRLSRRFTATVTVVASVAFILAASQLNRLCLVLALPTLVVLLSYSYAKRFTAGSHLWLGLGLGIAPVGSWIAVSGALAWQPVVLAVAVTLWVAGFDVIYSLQDEGFDRDHGLHSLPARFGARHALVLARLFHILALVGFAVFAVAAGGGWLRMAAVGAAGFLLAWQHQMVTPDDLSSVDAAFFKTNGILAVVMCLLFLFAKITGA
jgi:4-hydroxybenzoate polyprenyltransferase